MATLLDRLIHLIDTHADGKSAKFAMLCGINQGTFHNYTKGRPPNIASLNNICRTFNVNLNWLITGKGDPYLELDSPQAALKQDNEEQTGSRGASTSVHEEEPPYQASACPETGPPHSERFGHAASTLREVFDAGDNLLIAALEANLWAFKRASKHEQHIEYQNDLHKRMSEQMERLEKKCEELEAINQTLQSRISAIEGDTSRGVISGDDDADPKASAA